MLSVLADSFGEAQDLAKNMALVQGRKVVFKKDIYGDHRSYHAEKSSDKPFHMEVEEGASGLAFAEAGCQLGMQIAVALHAVEASVVSALADDDWLLVHDAARPCLSQQMLAALCDQLADDPVGGLLAVPVADTLKRADAKQRVAATEDRDALWQAQTPQMFRYGVLRKALSAGRALTDEAAAVEALGLRPLLVRADASNLKVTYPADLRLAQLILQGRDR